MPTNWINIIKPTTLSYTHNSKDQEWQTFWAILFTTTFLSLAFVSLKHEDTRLSKNPLITALAITALIGGVVGLNANYGSACFNPVLTSIYIMFEQSQLPADDYNHLGKYLW